MNPSPRLLRVFLCHSSGDKPVVRDLYQKLATEQFIDVWLDEVKLLPGMDWNLEIEKAVEAADVIIVCLSTSSVSKEGYVQREIKYALDIALEKPEGTIFVIPLRLDNCEPPRRLRGWHYADYFPENLRPRAYQRIMESLRTRAKHLNLSSDLFESGVVLPQATPSLSTSPITESSTTFASESPRSKASIPQPSAITWNIPIWSYGRLIALLLLLGLLGPGLGINLFEWIFDPEGYQIKNTTLPFGLVPLSFLPLAAFVVFLIALVRLLPLRFSSNPIMIRLERLTVGIAAICVYAWTDIFVMWIMWRGPVSELLGGFWGLFLVIAGVYLAIINIFFEFRSTMQKGEKYPWWSWLLVILIVLPWLVFFITLAPIITQK